MINDELVTHPFIIIDGVTGVDGLFATAPPHHALTFKGDSIMVLKYLSKVLNDSPLWVKLITSPRLSIIFGLCMVHCLSIAGT